MRIIIVEDEIPAARALSRMLQTLVPDVTILAVTDTVRETVRVLSQNTGVDLMLMDIHLADGSAFEVFQKTDIPCPVIFITAYDEYVMKAFKVCSLDYILKPYDIEDLRQALDKLDRIRDMLGAPARESGQKAEIQEMVRRLSKRSCYRSHILVPEGSDRMYPLDVRKIAYFYSSQGQSKAVDTEGHDHLFQLSLDELSQSLDPDAFFRASRQYLIRREAVRNIGTWFNGRLNVALTVPVPERVIISKARARAFRKWITGWE